MISQIRASKWAFRNLWILKLLLRDTFCWIFLAGRLILPSWVQKRCRKRTLRNCKQLAHCSAEKLSSLVKNSGMSDVDTPKINSEVVENCHVCSKFGRVKPRPISSLPMSVEWNQVVAMDLHVMSFA